MNQSKSKKHLSVLPIIRAVIQLLSFFIAPGLFITVFASLGDIWKAVISGTFRLQAYTGKIILLAAVLLVTLIFGRYFCGFVCSFGAMQDLLWAGGKHLPVKVKIPRKADRILKYIKYAVFVFIIAGVWSFGLFGETVWSPWTIFGMYLTFRGVPSAEYLFSLGALLLLVIIIGSLFVERFFCKYLCPLGALFAPVSRFRIFKINKPANQCGSCSLCSKKCSMSIPLSEYESVCSGECINCMKCTEACPRNNASASKAFVIAGIMAAAALTGVSYIGDLSLTEKKNILPQENNTTVQQSESGSYTDGTYTGSAKGYRGDISVTVTVRNGYIADINVNAYRDDREFFEQAENSVISEILNVQNTNVDTVSGATFSSRGIIAAVENALGSLPSESTVSEQEFSEPSEEISKISEQELAESEISQISEEISQNTNTGKFTDGTYTGSGTGYRGTTTVQVTVSNGKITDITILSYADDNQFFSRAANGVISEIISSQETTVDTVSGATFSSNGLMEAVCDALGIEFTNPNSSMNRHGRH